MDLSTNFVDAVADSSTKREALWTECGSNVPTDVLGRAAFNAPFRGGVPRESKRPGVAGPSRTSDRPAIGAKGQSL